MKSLIFAFALFAVACGAALPSGTRPALYDNSAIEAIVAAIQSDATDEATKPLLEALLIEAIEAAGAFPIAGIDQIAVGSGDLVVPAPIEAAIEVAPVVETAPVAETANSPLVEIILNINTNSESQADGIAAPALEKPTPAAQVEAVSVVSPIAPVEAVSVVNPVEAVSVVNPVAPVITEAVSVVDPVITEAVLVISPETPGTIDIAGTPEVITGTEAVSVVNPIEAVSVVVPVITEAVSVVDPDTSGSIEIAGIPELIGSTESVSVVAPVEAVLVVDPVEAVSVVAPVEAVSVVNPIITESVSDIEQIAVGSGDLIVPAPIDIAHPAIEAVEIAPIEESAPVARPPSSPLVEIILNINNNGESQAVSISNPAFERPTPVTSAISTPVEAVSVVSPIETVSVAVPVITETVSVVDPVITEAVSVVAPETPGSIGIAAIPEVISGTEAVSVAASVEVVTVVAPVVPGAIGIAAIPEIISA